MAFWGQEWLDCVEQAAEEENTHEMQLGVKEKVANVNMLKYFLKMQYNAKL